MWKEERELSEQDPRADWTGRATADGGPRRGGRKVRKARLEGLTIVHEVGSKTAGVRAGLRRTQCILNPEDNNSTPFLPSPSQMPPSLLAWTRADLLSSSA